MRWVNVVGFEDFYEVNEAGQIRRTKPGQGAKVGQIRKTHPLKGRGYMKIWLCGEGGRKKFMSVATVVCEAFHGPRPEGMQVNHKNGIKDDDRAENLEWVTPSQNTRHRFDVLKQQNPRGEQHGNAILTEEKVQLIRTLAKNGCTWRGIAEQMGIGKSVVMMILTGRNWAWLPFVEVDATGYEILSEHDMRCRAWVRRRAKSG